MSKLPLQIYTGKWNGGHIQGIAIDRERNYIYCSFTTEFVKLDMQGNLIGSVRGFTGHLGCMAYNAEDGRVYASLEYKNDIIGRGILDHMGIANDIKNAFYVAIFDVDKITRPDMNAETDGVMTTVWLREVVEDYLAEWQEEGVVRKHRYGCSGIDGMTFAPAFEGQGMRLLVAYGIYGDLERKDNDYQVLLSYRMESLKPHEAALTAENVHTSGPDACDERFFVYTGNTCFGIQNLEYDAYTGDIFAAVYKGEKPEYPNYDMFVIKGNQTPLIKELPGYYGEKCKVLKLQETGLCESGIYGYRFPFGQTGMFSLGDGRFYFSENHDIYGAEESHESDICLYRYTGEGPWGFEKLDGPAEKE